ncbi:hypothetical protein [Gordonia otitidis]|uniref:Uncharacterized protein n=1 Tax=Gordonia otitidis (strain DSM 44809 / CCUG 52243 / JCM 12355 / NBRC 100426 / IFM 10032) TaxID=1108044 RepID=H5TRT1_GORO1|nr:hypothetical protein [Gordonia otitidis]GAB36189.1 hypothetical protein GOOTI_202_00450 [Gordonia otitidis NBRC 100426]
MKGTVVSETITIIPVMYRDGSNCKRSSAIVAVGEVTDAQITRLRAALDDKVYYCPEQLELTHHGYGAWSSFPIADVDHGWHEMFLDSVTVSTTPAGGFECPCDEVGEIEDFVCRVEAASEAGWSPIDPSSVH